MKNNVNPNYLTIHPHYNEGNNQYDLEMTDIIKGLETAGYNPNDNKNWWEDENLADNISYRLEIHRDNGDFKTDTPVVLSVKLYSNNNDITDTVPASNFIWKRVSGNSEKEIKEDKIWNEKHEFGSKEITIWKDDVNRHAQFSVSFVIYEDDTAFVKNIYESYSKSISKEVI